MKYLWCAVLIACLAPACKKDPPAPALSPRGEQLTAYPWKYGEYYTGYGSSSYKRVYLRGASGNVVDFSDYRYVFKKSGEFELVLKQETIQGFWKFLDREQQIELSFPGAAPTILTIAALEAGVFDWRQDGYFARMIPQ